MPLLRQLASLRECAKNRTLEGCSSRGRGNSTLFRVGKDARPSSRVRMQRFCILLLLIRQYVIGAAYGRSRILPKSKKLHGHPSQLKKTSKAKNANRSVLPKSKKRRAPKVRARRPFSSLRKTVLHESERKAILLKGERGGPSRVGGRRLFLGPRETILLEDE